MEIDFGSVEFERPEERRAAAAPIGMGMDAKGNDLRGDGAGADDFGLARRDAAFQIEQYRPVANMKAPTPRRANRLAQAHDATDDDGLAQRELVDEDAPDEMGDDSLADDENGNGKGDGGEGKESTRPRVGVNAGVLREIDPNKKPMVAAPAVEPLALWFPTELKSEEIVARRVEIKRRVLAMGRGEFVLDVPTVKELVCQYDRAFFRGLLFDAFQHQQATADVKVGGVPMKKGHAGLCTFDGRQCCIILHPGLADLQFTDGHREDVNGIEGGDVLDCVQLVLEHELCHLLIYVFVRQKEAEHGRGFKALARGLFGHPFFTHTIGHRRRGEQSTAAQRVQEAQDAERKRPTFKPGSLVVLSPTNLLAAVLSSQEKSVTVMHSDGRIVEKIPYKLLNLCGGTDGAQKQEVNMADEIAMIESAYALFAHNKKTLALGSSIRYAGPDGALVQAQVVGKKPLGAVIQTSANTTLTLPFHTILSE